MNENMDIIKNKTFKYKDDLSKIPELGLEVSKTCAYIKKELDLIGIEYKSFIKNDIVGMIKGKNPKKTIAFRADMDALPFLDGAKHLCAHDGHMSILLGFINYINLNKDNLNDNIVFIFQPGEESPGGAKPMIENGLFDEFDIDEIYGLHIFPGIKQNFIGTKPNHLMAQVGEFDIKIKGKSSHGAIPQDGVDAILIAGNLINSINSIVSRNISPLDEGVITIGKAYGGDRRNIICEEFILEGTIRAYKEDVYQKLKKRISDIIKGIEISFNCDIKIRVKDDYPAVNNDLDLYLEFEQIFKDELIKMQPLMISEDFSYYQKIKKGLFFMLGSKNEEKGYDKGLHNRNFDFDKEVLLNGINIYIKLVKAKGVLF